jgi:hypothetical protein
MTFAHLTALWLSAVAIPIIALYLFRIRRRRQDVPHLALWRLVIEQRTASFLLRRLRRLWSLLLQLAIMSLIVFAVARPMLRALFQGDERLVLVIDDSASMQAVERDGAAPRTRLDRALDAARGRTLVYVPARS